MAPDFTGPAAAAEAAAAAAKRQRIEKAQAKLAEKPPGRSRPRGSKNPVQPEEAHRTYRLRMRLTVAQEQALKGWAAAQRAGYNALLAAHRDPDRRLPLNQESVNALARDTAGWMPDWMRATEIPRCVFKNAMLDLVSAEAGNRTKLAKNPRHHWEYKFRSLRGPRHPTEALRLDAAKFAPDDKLGLLRPRDAGPVLRILPVPEPDGRRTVGPPLPSPER